MQVSSSVSSRYYTPYQTNTSVKYCAGFSQTVDGKIIPNETTENPGFAEFVDYQEFHKAWMSQGAETAFSCTTNEGFNAETNSISLVPGMSVRLSNGFRLAIGDYIVQAMGDYKDNEAAKESAAIAGALSHLIKVANGQIPMNLFYSKNQDSSAYAKIGLQAFGIDTSRPFIINGKTFHFDNNEQVRLGSGQSVETGYQTKSENNSAMVQLHCGVNLKYNMYSSATTKAENDKTFKMGTATREATGRGDGKNIGVMAIGNQAYLAQYSENSTSSKPIVKVGNYEVSVNDVDPENATEIEMFALMSHLDKTGQSKNEGMSSFSKMRSYSQQAERNGFYNGIADANEAWNSKRNWTEIIENARQTYSQSLIPEVYVLTRKCDNLLDVMHKWIEGRKFAKQAAEVAQAAGTAPAITLHGAKEGTGDIAIFSGAEVVRGTSFSVFKTQDFDLENPVYKVKMWDESGNVTEQMVDVSKIDPKNCNTLEMYAYTAHLKESEKVSFEDTVLKAAVAKAVKNAESKSGSWSFSEKMDWVEIVSDIMQSSYQQGDLKGYMEWKKFLSFLEK